MKRPSRCPSPGAGTQKTRVAKKDAFYAKDQAKENESEDIDMDKSPPIESSTNTDDWQDVVDTDDVTVCEYLKNAT